LSLYNVTVLNKHKARNMIYYNLRATWIYIYVFLKMRFQRLSLGDPRHFIYMVLIITSVSVPHILIKISDHSGLLDSMILLMDIYEGKSVSKS
jgi:hypothetical protein